MFKFMKKNESVCIIKLDGKGNINSSSVVCNRVPLVQSVNGVVYVKVLGHTFSKHLL